MTISSSMKVFWIVGISVFLLALVGKFAVQKSLDKFHSGTEVDIVYDSLPISEGEQQNPIIIIPGYLGSRLEHSGNQPIAWGAFTKQTIDPRKPEGAQTLALPIDPDTPVQKLEDDVYSTGIIDAVPIKVAGFKTDHSVYEHLLRALQAGSASSNTHRYEFHYDWRKDNVAIAQQLHQFIEDKKAKIEADRKSQYGDNAQPVQFDIVAHSMGGLIARYYLRYGDQALEHAQINWAGSKNVDRLVLIAPPNLGSLKSLVGATEGYQGHPLLPKYSGAILSTFPSTYQLFPRDRHQKVVTTDGQPISIYNPQLWKQNQWGFFNPQNSTTLAALLPNSSQQEREDKALQFLANCLERAEKFHAALDRKIDQPEDLEVYLFTGDNIATPEKLAAGPLTKDSKVFEIVEWSPGDDTVTRRSSLSDERSRDSWQSTPVSSIKFKSTYFLSADHFGLTRNGAMFEGLLNILVKEPGSKH